MEEKERENNGVNFYYSNFDFIKIYTTMKKIEMIGIPVVMPPALNDKNFSLCNIYEYKPLYPPTNFRPGYEQISSKYGDAPKRYMGEETKNVTDIMRNRYIKEILSSLDFHYLFQSIINISENTNIKNIVFLGYKNSQYQEYFSDYLNKVFDIPVQRLG